MRRQPRRQVGTQQLIDRGEPLGAAQRPPGGAGEQRIQRGTRAGAGGGAGIRHRGMAGTDHPHDTLRRAIAQADRLRGWMQRRPWATLALLLGAGMLCGAAVRSAIGLAEVEALQAADSARQAELDKLRRDAQREVNALAARLAELQAQANHLNALGSRLARAGQLDDGEFDFGQAPGQGGGEAAHDMPPAELQARLSALEADYRRTDTQLGVLEALLFNRQLDRNALPSRLPIAGSYVTSGFGDRADPFGGGGQFHKGIDFQANLGDPVLAVADGVVSFAGVRSGYGNTIEVDHGNGYVTRYAHNARLTQQVGDLVRAGQEIARAGSSGRSTGAHVHFELWQDGVVRNPRKFLGHNDALARHGPARG